MGRFERAIEVGREAEELLDAAKRAGYTGKMAETALMLERNERSQVYAMMSDALEGLGRLVECADYHTLAIDCSLRSGITFPDTCYHWQARALREMGKVVEADEFGRRRCKSTLCTSTRPMGKGGAQR